LLGHIEPAHPCPSPDKSEEVRLNKLSAGKNLLRFKYWERPWVLVHERKMKRSKLVAILNHPLTMNEESPYKHNAPAPSAPHAV
jgi:hypothetical protein